MLHFLIHIIYIPVYKAAVNNPSFRPLLLESKNTQPLLGI